MRNLVFDYQNQECPVIDEDWLEKHKPKKKKKMQRRFMTEEEFDTFAPGEIMGKGGGIYPCIWENPIRWVAKKGFADDWAIYYLHAHHPFSYVETNGDKVQTISCIKQFVETTDEVLKKYRH